MSEFATEIIELPSKGLLYPEGNPLTSGKLTLRYMGARQEDILSNSNYIADGTVLDRMVQSLIVDKINYDDLIVGDKDALMVASRILGYGKNYSFNYAGRPYTIDLSNIEPKAIDENIFKQGLNDFPFETPNTGDKLTWKVLTHADEKKIQEDIRGWLKLNPLDSREISTRLKHIITSVNGKRERKDINEYVDSGALMAGDSKALRDYIKKVQPGVDLTFFPEGRSKAVNIPIGLDFFWVD
jgi:hypothetical protein